MNMINIDAMLKNINLPLLTELKVDKKEMFLKVFKATVHAHNLPTERLRYQEIEQLVDELEEWGDYELTDLIHYLLNYLTAYKAKHNIPKEIKLKLIETVNNRVVCFVRLCMCAKETSDMYLLSMENYSEQLDEVIEEPDVIDNPTFEDLEKLDV